MTATELDTLVVGAGFSGIYMLHRTRQLGMSTRLVEAGSGVGGTWFWNRYPGCRCDVETTDYQFSFDDAIVQGWTWSERYATHDEIRRYLEYVSERLDLYADMQFDTRVERAVWDEADGRWLVEIDTGEQLAPRHLIMATGCLSNARVPDYPGLDRFGGRWYHTGRWPHEGVDFSGLRVGVVGTGSSGIQSIPLIAAEAEHVTVFQRTPNFSVPAQNRPRDPDDEARMKQDFAARRAAARYTAQGVFASWTPNGKSALEVSPEEREAEFEARWQNGGFGFFEAFTDLITSREVNGFAADFAREKIRRSVRDPAVAELLCPKDHPFASKRLCVDTDYYATYNRPNVTLVDLRATPIEEITQAGIRTSAREFALDAIVFATGFDAMTGALLAVDIRGRDGLTLREKWAAGPVTYLGLLSHGFPNLFMLTGPGSPSVLSNMAASIEQHVEWTADCVDWLRDHDLRTIEPTAEAEADWVAHVNDLAARTLLVEANSWYLGANVPGKPRVFMPYAGGVGRYRTRCEEIAANGYEGFALGAQ